MDNLSKNIEESMANIQSPTAGEVTDIKFEEVFNIDKIQAEISKDLHGGDSSYQEPVQEEPKETEKVEFEELPKLAVSQDEKNDLTPQVPDFGSAAQEVDLGSKKYVVYVDSDNINYIEALSIKERREIVNKILREQNQTTIKEKELARRKKFIKHMVFACITFIIAFPIVFFVVNASMTATMTNYQQAKDNFSKLYKQQGKIQQVPMNAD